jgi:hypothetical protein
MSIKTQGPNPFDYLGLQISADGRRGTPTKWDGTKWVIYDDLQEFALNEQPQEKRGKNFQLKTWLRTYDWIVDNGFNNFSAWVG